jgi:hypothetical protein
MVQTDNKRNAIRAKIEESACAVFCLQETKIQSSDHSLVRKMAPKRFNKFSFVPSEGATGGPLCWVERGDFLRRASLLLQVCYNNQVHFYPQCRLVDTL